MTRHFAQDRATAAIKSMSFRERARGELSTTSWRLMKGRIIRPEHKDRVVTSVKRRTIGSAASFSLKYSVEPIAFIKTQATYQNLPKIDAIGRKDSVTFASFVHPSSMTIQFSDGLEGTWTFQQLDLDMSNMKLGTIKAAEHGSSVEVQSKYGETVQLDSSALRVVADPKYAAEHASRISAILSRIGQ